MWLGGSGTTAMRIGQILKGAVQTANCPLQQASLRTAQMPAINPFRNSTI